MVEIEPVTDDEIKAAETAEATKTTETTKSSSSSSSTGDGDWQDLMGKDLMMKVCNKRPNWSTTFLFLYYSWLIGFLSVNLRR
jgi:hypothetical protein